MERDQEQGRCTVTEEEEEEEEQDEEEGKKEAFHCIHPHS